MTTTQDLTPTATYAAFYVDNLRTGMCHQFGIVSGAAALQMLAKSPQPRRLVFRAC